MFRRLRRNHRFDLHAPKHLVEADNYVVAVAVSPGFGDGKTQACGFAHEGKLGKFAEMFFTEFGCVLKFVFNSFFGESQGSVSFLAAESAAKTKSRQHRVRCGPRQRPADRPKFGLKTRRARI